MVQLHEDLSFHYETLRSLGLSRYGGCDVSETFAILPNIKPGNFEDWYREWHGLAERVLSTIDESKFSTYSPVTLRDVYFRASHYYFMADFFLHGNPSDPRSKQCFNQWRRYFEKGNALLPIPGEHNTVRTSYGFDMPIIVYRAQQASASNPRPTLLVGGGFDSNMEETYHVFGVPALERGYNIVLYEGPGQPTLLHEQNVGFIHDWERAVTPIVDHIFAHKNSDLSFIDTSKIGLIGMSFGGYLAARAAAFEPRLAAVICIDGVWSLGDTAFTSFPECKTAWEQGDVEAVNSSFQAVSPESSTGKRWIHDHLKFSFQLSSGYEIIQRAVAMTLSGGVAEKIKMPAFIGEAEKDIFFLGQPAKAAQAIGPNATLVKFGTDQAAEAHCQSGALGYLNQQLHEWFAKVVGEK